MAEWSKAVDSSSTIFVCVGSNPTGVIQLKASFARRVGYNNHPSLKVSYIRYLRLVCKAPVAQSAEHRSYVARVEGSNPSGCKGINLPK